jgi:hypothetical protein
MYYLAIFEPLNQSTDLYLEDQVTRIQNQNHVTRIPDQSCFFLHFLLHVKRIHEILFNWMKWCSYSRFEHWILRFFFGYCGLFCQGIGKILGMKKLLEEKFSQKKSLWDKIVFPPSLQSPLAIFSADSEMVAFLETQRQRRIQDFFWGGQWRSITWILFRLCMYFQNFYFFIEDFFDLQQNEQNHQNLQKYWQETLTLTRYLYRI